MAVLVYLGVGISSFPTRLADAVSDYFGADRARVLIEKVDALLAEAWLGPSDWGSMTLDEATSKVRATMGAAHPELTVDAIEALAWDFSFSNK